MTLPGIKPEFSDMQNCNKIFRIITYHACVYTRLSIFEKSCFFPPFVAEAVYVGMTTLQTTTGKDTSNLTTANDIFNTSLFITKLHLMKNRTDTLESTIDTLGKDLSSLKTDVSVQEHLIQNNTYRIADLQFNRSSERRSLELQVAITEGLKADFESQGDNLLALNDTAIHLKALMNGFNYTLMNGNSKIVQLDADLKSSYDIINVHSSRIDLLESNRTADRGLILNITSEIAIFENRIILLESNRTTDRDLILRLMLDIDNHDDYMIELKSNMTADRRQIMSLSTVVSNIEANLTSTSKSIKTQSEILMTVNETLLRLETATNQLNIISKAYTDGLAELEEDIERKLVQIQTDIETNLENIVNNTDKIRLLEVNVTSVKNNAENLSVILSYLESEMESINGEVQNNHDGMASLIVDIQALNGSTSDSLSKLSTWLTDLKGNNFIYHITLLLRIQSYREYQGMCFFDMKITSQRYGGDSVNDVSINAT